MSEINKPDTITSFTWNNKQWTAKAFMDHVDEMWPKMGEDLPPHNLISQLESLLTQYPSSTQLLCMIGDLIRLGGTSSIYGDDAEQCYHQAILTDPLSADAYERLAFIADIQEKNEAEQLFEYAISCNGSADCYIGLANIMNSSGRKSQAIRVIDEGKSCFETAVEKLAQERHNLSDTESQ